jgi:enolase-phosphatase E1
MAIRLAAECGLFDIEGTVADIRFVYDVMFPYVRRELDAFLESQWNDPALAGALACLATDVGIASAQESWLLDRLEPAESRARIVQAVHALMDRDSKSTGLKTLQGLVWKSGFESGSLRAEMFDDVLPAWRRWRDAGVELRIYSSGSILAQKLFFSHTTQGDATGLLSGYYDTTIGNKREAESYARIATDCGRPPQGIVFFSDVAAELRAAAAAGMQTVGVVRPNHPEMDGPCPGPILASFDEIEWKPK